MRQFSRLVLMIVVIFQPAFTALGISTPPPPDPASAEIESQIEEAIQREIGLQQDRSLIYQIFETRIGSIHTSRDESWSIAYLNPIDPSTGIVIPAEPSLAIGQKKDGQWQIVLPGADGWAALIQSAPDSLIPEEDKTAWLNMYQEVSYPLDTTVYSGYKLPWEAGKKIVLTQSISHYNPPNPTGSMHYAFDFAAWHDASGQSPMFAVHAAKGGRVKWARWTQVNGDEASPGNYLVIEDTSTTPYTYALYLHLAQNSIPEALRVVGATVLQGQYIGLADDTGNSTGNHLHFQVHTNPSSYWGNSVDITFSDVSINGGRPRTPTEATSWPQYGAQGQWEYTSGNSIPGESYPPSGGISSPGDKNRFNTPLIQITGWAQDDTALASVQIKAHYSGAWHNVGPAITTSPFNYNWGVCEDNVPDGPITLMLDIRDANGNLAQGTPGLTRLIKEYECPVPRSACVPNSNEITLFAEPGYRGDCVRLSGGAHASSAFGLVGNDNAESVMVGSQVWVTLFNEGQQGRGKTFWENDSNLSDDPIGSNHVSSISVQPKATAPTIPRPVFPADGVHLPANASLSLSWDDSGGGSEFMVKVDGLDYPWQVDTYFHLGSISQGEHSWQTRSRNPYGTSNWSTLRRFTIDPPFTVPDAPSVTVPFTDTMENGYNGWDRGEWDQTMEENHTPQGSISFNYEINDRVSDYNTGVPNSGYLTSPQIVITSPGYALQFWYLYETESPGIHWDQRWVQLSVDGGHFMNLLQLYDDPPNVWLQSPPLDLSAYSGHTIQVRFLFETMDAALNAFRGWYIDDFSINLYTPPECSDLNEPDPTPGQAYRLSYNTSTARQLCPMGDIDQFRFSGEVGDRVGVLVHALEDRKPDSYVFLLDKNFASVLAENDDQILGIRTDSYASYRLLESGEFYIRLKAWDHPSAGGSDFNYLISLFGEDYTSPAAAFTSPRNNVPYSHGIIPIEVTANDPAGIGEVATGIGHVEFFWHSDDWANTDWVSLGTDWDGLDGWGYNFDTTSMPEIRLITFFVRVYDWAGNSYGEALWDICLGDSACKWYLPLIVR